MNSGAGYRGIPCFIQAVINLTHVAQSVPIGLRVSVRFCLMVFRNSNHGGRQSWLPTIEPSKTKSVLANSNQGQTSADCVPCLKTPPDNSFEDLDLGVKRR
jgi:hypothetical protein